MKSQPKFSQNQGETEEQILEIVDLSRDGSGVAKNSKGQVVFVPFSAPGDRLKVRWTSSSRRYVEAEILEIVEASPVRQTPPCSIFGKCGGCQWQHIPYALQWQTKVKGAQESLRRMKIPLPERMDLEPAQRVWEYRNRIQLRGQGQELGFYQAGSHQLVNVNRCEIARPEINESWEQTRTEGLRRSHPYKVEVEVTSQGEIQRTWNAPHSAAGFRQVHDEQNEKLKQWIHHSLRPAPVLYDLYGGSGNLSRLLLDKMGEIHCVDRMTSMKSQGSQDRMYFHDASVATWIREQARSVPSSSFLPVAAILDPPREGMGTVADSIIIALEQLGVREAILVGCNADAWAKDLSRWVIRHWKVQSMLIIDLFPQTAHIEAVAHLAL